MLYYLMHKNIQVLELELQEDIAAITQIKNVHNEEHIPVGITRKDGVNIAKLNKWWKGRSIPASRQGISDALEIMNLNICDELILKCYGLSLSDQYWVCPQNINMKWEDVNFFDNDFSDDVGNALFGHKNSDSLSLMSPDNTSDGFLKKKWNIINGKRFLIKSGSNPFFQEPLNEVLASEVHKRLNYMPYVEYALDFEGDTPYSLCENFVTKNTELVNALSINESVDRANDVPAYEHFIRCCESFNIKKARQQINYMLVVDFIIANSDRHLRNFGAVRNADTLEYMGMAPIFDSGTSMWYNKASNYIKPIKADESKPFKKNHSEQIKLVDDFSWIDFNSLKDIGDAANDIYSKSAHIDAKRRSQLCYAVEYRIKMLNDISLK